MDRGLSLRTYFWLAGSGFIVAAHLAFVAYLRFALPWWALALLLGTLVALVVAVLEHVLARPLERLAKVSTRSKDGQTAPPPGGLLSASEVRRIWKALRGQADHLTQARQAQRAVEAQLGLERAHTRMLAAASRALRPEVPVEQVVPEVLRELATLLGVEDVYLVPLRRHCPVPVTGGRAAPDWAAELRASGLAPWDDLLAQNRPVSVCLSPLAPGWRSHFGESPIWVVPLVYHGKPQGLLLAPASGQDREWTPEEWLVVQSVANVLSASLHPPRWSEERVVRRAEPAPEPEAEPSRAAEARRRRRRARQGA